MPNIHMYYTSPAFRRIVTHIAAKQANAAKTIVSTGFSMLLLEKNHVNVG
jgi:hypothetical protein